ncbi:hypothetical protein EBR03_09800 [bacterium]|nr:hypothetical protein [bacterium]
MCQNCAVDLCHDECLLSLLALIYRAFFWQVRFEIRDTFLCQKCAVTCDKLDQNKQKTAIKFGPIMTANQLFRHN